MKRIFQIGVGMLLLAIFATPVLEYFDRWDSPGLGSDTEFALFAIVLVVCLLLAVCKLLSDRAQNTDVERLPMNFVARPPTPRMKTCRVLFAVIPSLSPPLRI